MMPQKTSPWRRVIPAAEQYVKGLLAQEGSGHDWFHIDRVRRMAVRIAKQEKVNIELVELMALLHDLADRKVIGHGNEKAGLKKINSWLEQQGVTAADREHIIYIIANQSYAVSGFRQERLASPEGQIVQDADRLDAIGAIGIGRAFIYGGRKGHPLHDPRRKPRKNLKAHEYKKEKNTIIQHFYEKLLKLQDLMNTKTGKRLARHRHKVMEKFLDEFYAEWDGKR
jgi:uncharacterized protein